MVAPAQPRSAGAAGGPEATAERLLEPAVIGAACVLGVALLLPVALPGLPVCGALWWLRTRRRAIRVGAYCACALPAPAAAMVALATFRVDPLTLAARYVDVPFDAGRAVLATWPDVDWRAVGLACAGGLWPYALAVGPLVGLLGWWICDAVGRRWNGNDFTKLCAVSADELGRLEGRAAPQPVAGLAALGRLTAITALPKTGKTYAWFGLLKARQTGGRWFGRKVEPGKTLVLSEEDRGTFGAKVKAFGITGTALVSVHAPETADSRFGQAAWPALVHEAARLARRNGCDTLTCDTLTTWAPWAFRGPEAMSFCLRTLKAACVRHKLAGVVILHNRKQQSDLGAVVDMLGTIAGSAAYDVIAGFSREKQSGQCTLTVDGRLGEWSCIAVLRDGRYVPVGSAGDDPDAPDGATAPASSPADGPQAVVPLPAHLAPTLATVRGRPGASTGELLAAEGGSKRGLLDRLGELHRLGLVTRRGRGVRGDPVRWTATEAPTTAPTREEAATADPAYDAYLRSARWAAKRAGALARAGGACESCGDGTPAAEVHHLERPAVLGEESLGALQALCAPCHRSAHARRA
jgi:hypothetical protein